MNEILLYREEEYDILTLLVAKEDYSMLFWFCSTMSKHSMCSTCHAKVLPASCHMSFESLFKTKIGYRGHVENEISSSSMDKAGQRILPAASRKDDLLDVFIDIMEILGEGCAET